MKKIVVVLLVAAGALSGCIAYEEPRRAGYYGDRDRDGISNRADRDRDGDGIRNRDDRRPDDPRRY